MRQRQTSMMQSSICRKRTRAPPATRRAACVKRGGSTLPTAAATPICTDSGHARRRHNVGGGPAATATPLVAASWRSGAVAVAVPGSRGSCGEWRAPIGPTPLEGATRPQQPTSARQNMMLRRPGDRAHIELSYCIPRGAAASGERETTVTQAQRSPHKLSLSALFCLPVPVYRGCGWVWLAV